jgi:hypothetical protein
MFACAGAARATSSFAAWPGGGATRPERRRERRGKLPLAVKHLVEASRVGCVLGFGFEDVRCTSRGRRCARADAFLCRLRASRFSPRKLQKGPGAKTGNASSTASKSSRRPRRLHTIPGEKSEGAWFTRAFLASNCSRALPLTCSRRRAGRIGRGSCRREPATRTWRPIR